jgi:excisionase family DNA binding protein
MPDEVLTPEEIAKRLKISVHTLEKWRHGGLIPAMKLNYRTIRYSWPAVFAALQNLSGEIDSACTDEN